MKIRMDRGRRKRAAYPLSGKSIVFQAEAKQPGGRQAGK